MYPGQTVLPAFPWQLSAFDFVIYNIILCARVTDPAAISLGRITCGAQTTQNRRRKRRNLNIGNI